jgi:hypothetical protein
VRGESDPDGHIADRIFENQVPADDPCDEFAHTRVGVRVSGAGDGNHGGQFGITERGKRAHDGDEDKRQRDGGAGAGTAEGWRTMDQVFEQRSIDDGAELQLLTGDRSPDNGEDAGADNGTNAKRGERPGAERLL